MAKELRVDYPILHGLNAFVTAHPLLAHTATLLATWIVPVIVAATVIPWLASGAGVDARKMATAGALAAAALAMGVNQAIGLLWQRPRPSVAPPAPSFRSPASRPTRRSPPTTRRPRSRSRWRRSSPTVTPAACC